MCEYIRMYVSTLAADIYRIIGLLKAAMSHVKIFDINQPNELNESLRATSLNKYIIHKIACLQNILA